MSRNPYIEDINSDYRLIYQAEVKSIDDTADSGIIYVELVGINNGQLVECYPLIPKFMNVFPQVGETVFIILQDIKIGPKIAKQGKAFWVGPIISQLQNLKKDPHDYTSTSNQPDGKVKTKVGISSLENAKGAYPKKEDIAIQGRDNTDIILKSSESTNGSKQILLRSGKFVINDNLTFNKKDVSFIQIKYGTDSVENQIIEKSVQKQKSVAPEIKITASIISVRSNGSFIEDESLTDDQYNLQATSHLAKVDLTYLKGSSKPISFQQSYTNRSDARDSVKNKIEEFKTYNVKWIIKSTTKQLLDFYGDKMIFPNSTITVTEKIKETIQVKRNVNSNGGVINVVANKINLISHDGGHGFKLTDINEMITDKEQEKINKDAQSIVFGEKLVDFLKLLKNYVGTHVHPYHGMPSVDETSKLQLLNYDLDQLLNKNIRTN